MLSYQYQSPQQVGTLEFHSLIEEAAWPVDMVGDRKEVFKIDCWQRQWCREFRKTQTTCMAKMLLASEDGLRNFYDIP